MRKKATPNWDEFAGRKMFVPFFVYGRNDLDVGPLEGFCRGHGAISGTEQSYQDTIGIYTAEGVYYNILIDTRLVCAVPTFFIDDKPLFFPIVACMTVCGGLPVIDPATGIMRRPGKAQKQIEGVAATTVDQPICRIEEGGTHP